MDTARPEDATNRSSEGSLLDRLRSLGPVPFAILFAAFFSPYFLIEHLAERMWTQNLGHDFVAFYAAASLAVGGDAASAYNHAAMLEAQRQASGTSSTLFPWFYPPIMFGLVAPLGLLPYPAAFALWIVAPLIALLLVVRRYAGHALASVAILIFPGTLQSVLAGQNGVLSALIVTGGLLNLERKPALAGAILGLLSYKPHVAAAVYAALLIGRQWLALATAVGVALALAIVSLVALGPEPWLAFLRETEIAKTFMEDGRLRWTFMTTPFAAAQLAGVDVSVSYALQFGVALGALAALFVVWRRDVPLEQRGAVLVAVIPLISPYAFSYDLPVLGLAMLWLLRMGFATGFRTSELIVFPVAWIIAPLGWLIAEGSGVLLTPIVLVALLGVLLNRILRGGDSHRIGARSAAAGTR